MSEHEKLRPRWKSVKQNITSSQVKLEIRDSQNLVKLGVDHKIER